MENPLLDEIQSDVDENESLANEEKVEAPPALEGQDRSEAAVETREEQGSPEEFSASGWEEYFGRDRRSGESEYSAAQDEFPSYEQTVAKATSLEEHLLWQLSLSGLGDREKELGRLIIGNLDDDGYLRIPLAEVVAGTRFYRVRSRICAQRHSDFRSDRGWRKRSPRMPSAATRAFRSESIWVTWVTTWSAERVGY